MSPNQGQVWNLMNPSWGNPLIIDVLTGDNVNPVTEANPNSSADTRIVLAMPSSTGNAVEDAIYAGWLYAAVYTPPGIGLFMTKDFGRTGRQFETGTLPPDADFNQAIPTNDVAERKLPAHASGPR